DHSHSRDTARDSFPGRTNGPTGGRGELRGSGYMVQQGKRGIGLWIGSIVLLAFWVVLEGMVGDGMATELSRAQPAPGRGAAADPATPVPSGVIVKGGKLSVSLRGARF